MLEQTCCILKPDLFARELMRRRAFEELTGKFGFRLIDQKTVKWSLSDAKTFYRQHQDRFFYNRLCYYMASGPIQGLLLEKNDAIADLRFILGNTSPVKARLSFPDSLRARYGLSNTRNSFHGSGKWEEANVEKSFLFS